MILKSKHSVPWYQGKVILSTRNWRTSGDLYPDFLKQERYGFANLIAVSFLPDCLNAQVSESAKTGVGLGICSLIDASKVAKGNEL